MPDPVIGAAGHAVTSETRRPDSEYIQSVKQQARTPGPSGDTTSLRGGEDQYNKGLSKALEIRASRGRNVKPNQDDAKIALPHLENAKAELQKEIDLLQEHKAKAVLAGEADKVVSVKERLEARYKEKAKLSEDVATTEEQSKTFLTKAGEIAAGPGGMAAMIVIPMVLQPLIQKI